MADPPWAVRTARGFRGQMPVDAEAAQRRKAGAPNMIGCLEDASPLSSLMVAEDRQGRAPMDENR